MKNAAPASLTHFIRRFKTSNSVYYTSCSRCDKVHLCALRIFIGGREKRRGKKQEPKAKNRDEERHRSALFEYCMFIYLNSATVCCMVYTKGHHDTYSAKRSLFNTHWDTLYPLVRVSAGPNFVHSHSTGSCSGCNLNPTPHTAKKQHIPAVFGAHFLIVRKTRELCISRVQQILFVWP